MYKDYKEFSWVVEQQEGHDLWKDFVKWLNENSPNKYNGRKRRYYGYDKSLNKLRGVDTPLDMPKDAEVISMEQWYFVSGMLTEPAGTPGFEYDPFTKYVAPINSEEEFMCVKMALENAEINIYDGYEYQKGVTKLAVDTNLLFGKNTNSLRAFKNAGYREVTVGDLIPHFGEMVVYER